MAYFMTWSNFNEGNFDEPYMVTAKRGHEMVNQFIDFYNAPQSAFAKELPDFGKLSVKAVPAEAEYGYMAISARQAPWSASSHRCRCVRRR